MSGATNVSVSEEPAFPLVVRLSNHERSDPRFRQRRARLRARAAVGALLAAPKLTLGSGTFPTFALPWRRHVESRSFPLTLRLSKGERSHNAPSPRGGALLAAALPRWRPALWPPAAQSQ